MNFNISVYIFEFDRFVQMVEECEEGPTILRSELQAALLEMKEGKAVGVDEIPAELLKSLGEKALQELYEICKQIYEEGKWPDDFTRVAMIPLPKRAMR